MAIWFVTKELKEGPLFGSEQTFEGLAIFLDSNSNRHQGKQYISGLFSNGSKHSSANGWIGGCEANFRGLKFSSSLLLTLENSTFTLKTDLEGKNLWKDCFTAKIPELDLVKSSHSCGLRLGLSASTGANNTDEHKVLSLRSYELEPFDDRTLKFHDYALDDKEKKARKGYTFRILVALAVACLIGMLLYVGFRRRANGNARNRMYS